MTIYTAADNSVIELTVPGSPPHWAMRRGESPSNLACNSGSPTPQCVVVDGDFHGGLVVTSYLLSTNALVSAGSVTTHSSRANLSDLNHDGYIDPALMQVAAKSSGVYWETYVFHDHRLASTGCGPVQTQIGLTSSPQSPETGTCPN